MWLAKHKSASKPLQKVVTLMCPNCHVGAVIDEDRSAHEYTEIRSGDYMRCQNCGSGFTVDKADGIVKLLDIEAHEFDNDPIGSGKPLTTTLEEDKPFNDIYNSTILGSEYNMKYSTLVDKLTDTTKDFMLSKGYLPEDVVEYFTVDVSPTEDNQYLSAEVGAELDYDSISALADMLNPIVQDVDADAYFDVEEPGIIIAYVPYGSIESSTSINAADLPDYGGAFDIDPYSFWTKEELLELGNSVANSASHWLHRHGEGLMSRMILTDAYLEDDYKTITLEFEDRDEYTYSISEKIDMRKIRKPSDLISRYESIYMRALVDACVQNHSISY